MTTHSISRGLCAAAAVTLLLSGCSSDSNTDAPTAGNQPASTGNGPIGDPADDNPAMPGDNLSALEAEINGTGAKTPAKVGETFKYTCHPQVPCDVDFTVTELTLGEACKYGTNDYGGSSDSTFGKLKPGEQYLQMSGEFIVNSAANGWTMAQEPFVIDADGYTTNASKSIDCRSGSAPLSDWATPVHVEEKAKLYGAWIVPEGITAVTIGNKKIDVTNL
ncbi:hypothetical protein OS127_03090 [Corynebacterium sp. P6129]|uniref:hypothetical protein n=1 Tax=Corynebacterium antarcticum TaxID=2800405 RepID=UPI002260DDE2|nr:hypothetical protein [Corynebacterium antarcticum]MCX7491514.1 hypothetical protein [Corynebacterium antarcticum]